MKRSYRKYLPVFILLLSFISLAGCGKTLTKREIAQANLAFCGDAADGKASEIGCFFTCYYSDPREIDLWDFLRYCPAHVRLTYGDEQEFFDWLDASDSYLDGVTWKSPEEYFVPVWRYSKESVSALLTKYAGITADDLNSWGEALYMEKYDSFYNCTSDYGPGRFVCVGGERDGKFLRFWSETDQEGRREVLTLEEIDGTYLIRSFQCEKVK